MGEVALRLRHQTSTSFALYANPGQETIPLPYKQQESRQKYYCMSGMSSYSIRCTKSFIPICPYGYSEENITNSDSFSRTNC